MRTRMRFFCLIERKKRSRGAWSMRQSLAMNWFYFLLSDNNERADSKRK